MSEKKILVIEDDEDILELVVFNLSTAGYLTRGVVSGERGLEELVRFTPDLILLDMMLPGIDGMEVCRRIKQNPATCGISVIMLTACGEDSDIVSALEIGADDYITKPFSLRVLLARVGTELRKRSDRDARSQNLVRESLLRAERQQSGIGIITGSLVPVDLIPDKGFSSVSDVKSGSGDREESRVRVLCEDDIEALLNAIEARDSYTRSHTDRVTEITLALARNLGWGAQQLDQAYIGAQLHDIGKIGIPDAILCKPALLTPGEYTTMKRHVAIGLNIVRDMPVFRGGLSYIRCHHERLDGKGYPDGLKGLEIPVEGRLVAVADCFDAMTSDRPYRRSMSISAALDAMIRCCGTQLDPELVRLFIDLLESGELKEDALCGSR